MIMGTIFRPWLIIIVLVVLAPAGNGAAARLANPLPPETVGPRDSLMVTRCADGEVVLARNSRRLLVPASIIKLLTALAAIHYLGPEFRYVTEFYQSPQDDLIVKGYGDPCLVSREIARAARQISRRMERLHNIYLDDTYFAATIDIPGRQEISRQPYDAPNSALCVNFNSLAVKRENGAYVSAEPETPLVPFARQKIQQANGFQPGRHLLIQHQDQAAVYAGALLQYFLEEAGLVMTGKIARKAVINPPDRLLLAQASTYPLLTVIEKLLRYSNNFMANQLLLTCGARVYGPPATLAKGLRALRLYAAEQLSLQDLQLAEGSGLSRQNRLSAAHMSRILVAFEPYRRQMRHHNREYYKTGTLDGVSSRAGYLRNKQGTWFTYVIIRNSPGKEAAMLLPVIRNVVENQ